MKDLQLWNQLVAASEFDDHDERDNDEPVFGDAWLDSLEEVCGWPLTRRFIFLPAYRTLRQHQDPAVRRLAVRLLHGAQGWEAEQATVDALADEDPQVVAAALDNLVRIARKNPLICVHAIFHRQLSVRRMACRRVMDEQSPQVWLLLYALTDNQLAPTLKPVLLERSLDQLHFPLLFELFRCGGISEDELLQLLLNAGASAIAEIVKQGPRYRDSDIEAISAGKPPLEYDVLQLLFAIAANCQSAVRKEFVEMVVEVTIMLEPIIGFTSRLRSAILQTGREHGWWYPRLCGISSAFGGELLLEAEIPREVRYEAIETIYELGTRCRAARPGTLTKMLTSDLCLHEDGGLDLWVIGGMLYLCGGDPYRVLLEQYSAEDLTTAFWIDPPRHVGLFSYPSAAQSRSELLAQVTAGRRAGGVLAMLACTVANDGLEFLSEIAADAVVDFFESFMELAQQPHVKVADRKLTTICHHLMGRLPNDRQGSQRLRALLRIWLGATMPERVGLGLELWTQLARQWPAEELSAVAFTLPKPLLLRLVRLIGFCPGFPYGTEMLFAEQLRGSEFQELREWARSRVFEKPSDVTPKIHLEKGQRETSLSVTPELARLLTNCPDSELDDVLEPCLLHPHLGICRPLLARDDSPGQIPAIAAAVGSSDPLGEVQGVYQKFSKGGSGFLNELDAAMLEYWQYCAELSVLGNAWLYRWESHAFTFADQAMQSAESTASWLGVATALRPVVLGRRIWSAVSRVMGIWRCRDRGALLNVLGDPLESALIKGLASPFDKQAAAIWISIGRSGVADSFLANARPKVVECLPLLRDEVRAMLSGWIDTSGLTAAVVSRPTRSVSGLDHSGLISQSTDFPQLEQWCRSADGTIVSDAALRLLELGDPGMRSIESLLRDAANLPCAAILAEAVGLWEAEHWPLARELAADESLPNAIRFIVALSLAELLESAGGESTRLDDHHLLLDLLRRPTDKSWFLPDDLSRLLKLKIPFKQLAAALTTSPHPFAYRWAIGWWLSVAERGEDVDDAVPHFHAFLDCGDDREHELRSQVAEWLLQQGDRYGYPLVLQRLSGKKVPQGIVEPAAEQAMWSVRAVLLAGPQHVPEGRSLILVAAAVERDQRYRDACAEIMQSARNGPLREAAAKPLRNRLERNRKLRLVAEVFRWGIHIGRELTGRVMSVEMIGGDALGYTRLNENRIYINPLPLMSGARHGRDIVEGLILHEYGHHMYHRGEREEKCWEQAQQDGVGRLLNLVSDEHLERNLRAMDRDFGDRLKRLAAHAFQHDQRDIAVMSLLNSLRTRSYEVLTHCDLSVGMAAGTVRVGNAGVLHAMERAGSSFSRFFRALRMGLGNRHNDPKVDEALALFRGKFRQRSMEELLEITYRLRRIFQHEADLLEAFEQDQMLAGSDADRIIHGEGISNEQVQSEIQRISNPCTDGAPDDAEYGGLARWLNVSEDQEFTPIHTVVRLPMQPDQHAELVAEVARDARHFRSYLAELGLTMRPERRRLRGRRLDRSNIQNLLLKADPRILIAREAERNTDLFMGVVIDCSGSMEVDENIRKAKLFAAMLSEACRGLSGVDLRLFGFTDSVIYDAGDANRPALAALHANGGNNDSAALWHAAQVALRSRRRARLLVMISDGLPTECSVASLRALVDRLTRTRGICCAQVAVAPLEEICFPHYTLLEGGHATDAVRRFGVTIARLVQQTIGR